MWEQVAEIGARSQIVVGVTGAFTGAVLAAQTLFQFKLFGLETAAGGLVSVAMLRLVFFYQKYHLDVLYIYYQTLLCDVQRLHKFFLFQNNTQTIP